MIWNNWPQNGIFWQGRQRSNFKCACGTMRAKSLTQRLREIKNNPMVIIMILVFISPLLWGIGLGRLAKSLSFLAQSLLVYLITVGTILLVGYSLSQFNQFNQFWAWALCLLPLGGIGLGLLIRTAFHFPDWKTLWSWDFPPYQRYILLPLLSSIALLGLFNIWIALTTFPINWDSHTYHLARAAYYLQHGNVQNYATSFLPQVVIYKHSAVIHSFILVTFPNFEPLLHIQQYVAYWVMIFAIWGISRAIGASRFYAWLVSGMVGLFTIVLLQATTTQNDLIIAAHAAVGVYSLFAFRKEQRLLYLAMASAAFAMMIGHKASSALIGFSVAILVLGIFISTPQIRRGIYLIYAPLALGIGFILFILPSGFLENINTYGDPLGPEDWRNQHELHLPIRDQFIQGSKNFARHTLNFVAVDGLQTPNLEMLFNNFRLLIVNSLEKFEISLQDPIHTRVAFTPQRSLDANEDTATWGVLGIALILPIWVIILFDWRSRSIGWARVFSWAGMIFLLMQSFTSLYDPWRGRLFMQWIVFLAPAVALYLTKIDLHWHRWNTQGRLSRSFARLLYLYVVVALALGCWSGMQTLWFTRTDSLALFNLPRVEQMMFRNPGELNAILAFEQHVPDDATILLELDDDTHYYVMFGEGRTRHLYASVEDYISYPNGIPPDYRVYTTSAAQPNSSDVLLGIEWGTRYWYLEQY
jgi:hypothetical protein